jgi:hypothetical protein
MAMNELEKFWLMISWAWPLFALLAVLIAADMLLDWHDARAARWRGPRRNLRNLLKRNKDDLG